MLHHGLCSMTVKVRPGEGVSIHSALRRLNDFLTLKAGHCSAEWPNHPAGIFWPFFFPLHIFPFARQLSRTIMSSCFLFLIQTRRRCYMRWIAAHNRAILFMQILKHSCALGLAILRSKDSTQTEAIVWKLSLIWICTLLTHHMCDSRWEHVACCS